MKTNFKILILAAVLGCLTNDLICPPMRMLLPFVGNPNSYNFESYTKHSKAAIEIADKINPKIIRVLNFASENKQELGMDLQNWLKSMLINISPSETLDVLFYVANIAQGNMFAAWSACLMIDPAATRRLKASVALDAFGSHPIRKDLEISESIEKAMLQNNMASIATLDSSSPSYVDEFSSLFFFNIAIFISAISAAKALFAYVEEFETEECSRHAALLAPFSAGHYRFAKARRELPPQADDYIECCVCKTTYDSENRMYNEDSQEIEFGLPFRCTSTNARTLLNHTICSDCFNRISEAARPHEPVCPCCRAILIKD